MHQVLVLFANKIYFLIRQCNYYTKAKVLVRSCESERISANISRVWEMNPRARIRQRARERVSRYTCRKTRAIRRRRRSRLGGSFGILCATRERVIRVELKFMVEQTEITELRRRSREPKSHRASSADLRLRLTKPDLARSYLSFHPLPLFLPSPSYCF